MLLPSSRWYFTFASNAVMGERQDNADTINGIRW